MLAMHAVLNRPRGLKAKDPLQYAHDAGLTKTVVRVFMRLFVETITRGHIWAVK